MFSDLAEHLPRTVTTDWSNCRHEFLKKNGHTHGGKRSVCCRFCGAQITTERERCVISSAQIRKMAELQSSGLGYLRISRLVGIPASTVSVWLRKIKRVIKTQTGRNVSLENRARVAVPSTTK